MLGIARSTTIGRAYLAFVLVPWFREHAPNVVAMHVSKGGKWKDIVAPPSQSSSSILCTETDGVKHDNGSGYQTTGHAFRGDEGVRSSDILHRG